MLAFWAPWEYIMEMCLLLFSSTNMAPFLRKLQWYIAQTQDFLIHTMKHAVTECIKYMRDLRLAKSFHILPM
jgi:hypothetical protein